MAHRQTSGDTLAGVAAGAGSRALRRDRGLGTAAIGIMVGVGRPLMGFGLAVLVRAVLVGVRRWEIRRLGGLMSAAVEVLFEPDHGKTRIRLNCALEEFHVRAPWNSKPTRLTGFCGPR